MQPLPLSAGAARLVSGLEKAQNTVKPGGHVFHVASLGAGFYFAYEQLRNAAQYREHHLLLRSAIERFLANDVNLRKFEPIAADLVTELTQAGYLKNDSIPMTVVETIDGLLSEYAGLFHTLTKDRRVPAGTATRWILQYASVRIENLLTPDPKMPVFMQFAYEHYLLGIDAPATERVEPTDQQYRIALFCAVQRAIFKSNLATIRYHCFNASLGNLEKQPVEHIVQLNTLIDNLHQAPVTNRLSRLVNRYGAPMRMIRELIMEGDAGSIRDRRGETISKIKAICSQQYVIVHEQLKSRIAKTILFVLITKTLVGIAIEVPYDILIHGAVAWLPLGLNIGFPVLYMATIGARIQTPSRQNTEVVASYADRILYQHDANPLRYKPKKRVKSRSLNGLFTAVYALGFIGSIALLIWILHELHFNLANGAIFFFFFSAVSFLGFRLRQSARELELIDEHAGLVQALIDFLSTPFVRVGHWLSDKYAKANIVTFILDTAIELPLKTSLRMVRQWVGFLRDKQEEL